jgi:hypothetical protein
MALVSAYHCAGYVQEGVLMNFSLAHPYLLVRLVAREPYLPRRETFIGRHDRECACQNGVLDYCRGVRNGVTLFA